MSVSITVTSTPTDEEFEAVNAGLADFNERDAGPANFQMLMVLVRDDDGGLVAGIYAVTHWGWLYVQKLWVTESHRGQGIAAQMLAAAEDEASERGCHGAWIDTFNPVALKVYREAGYEIFGELPDFPKGRTRTFLRKSLGPV